MSSPAKPERPGGLGRTPSVLAPEESFVTLGDMQAIEAAEKPEGEKKTPEAAEGSGPSLTAGATETLSNLLS